MNEFMQIGAHSTEAAAAVAAAAAPRLHSAGARGQQWALGEDRGRPTGVRPLARGCLAPLAGRRNSAHLHLFATGLASGASRSRGQNHAPDAIVFLRLHWTAQLLASRDY